MKVLLLHPEDDISRCKEQTWNLVVDLARAPAKAYQEWGERLGCPVISIYGFAKEVTDLYRLRDLLRSGDGSLIDEHGIDLWNVLSLELLADMHLVILAGRLAEELGPTCELYSRRPHPIATALQCLLQSPLRILQAPIHSAFHHVAHPYRKFSRLDSRQLLQILEDKLGLISLNASHARSGGTRDPVILCPTAYVNGSRMAAAYATLMSDHQFALVYTRRSGRLESLPANMRECPLDSYSRARLTSPSAGLMASWEKLRVHLGGSARAWRIAEDAGILRKVPDLLRWALALGEAWTRVFERENVAACLCTDDSNPPTRIPFLLAKLRGIPALVVHHGALDYAQALKTHDADSYIAKTRMEADYLTRVCDVPAEKVALGSPPNFVVRSTCRENGELVFFTEPYENFGWRTDALYRQLLPQLYELAQLLRLPLAFKLHPFESARGFRGILKRYARLQCPESEIISGVPTSEFWTRVKVALTVQSSVALECAERGIPIFLCAWFRDSLSGYTSQLAKFGNGTTLRSAEELLQIRNLMTNKIERQSPVGMRPETMFDLISNCRAMAQVANA